MFSLFSGKPVWRAAPRRLSALAVYAGIALVCILALTGTERATPLAIAEVAKIDGTGAEMPLALTLTKPAVPALGHGVPTPDPAKKIVLKRRAWMVQTDDWNERLSSGAFWRSRSSGSGSYNFGRRSNRMSLGQSGGSSGSGAQDSSNGNNDSGSGEPDPGANEVTGEGSEFYTGDGDTYRTVCVRSCDGYFSPVSFSTTEDNFERDSDICESRCGSGAKLYVFENPGETPQDMVDLEGEPYSDLKTAFLFKTKYIPSCTCKPHPWSQASRNRHKVYALKAATRGKRGNSRKLAKAALRKYRREVRRRQQITRIRTVERIAMLAMAGEAELSASMNWPTAGEIQTAEAQTSQDLILRAQTSQIKISQIETSPVTTSLSQAALNKQRRASLSPVRSLTDPVLPPEARELVAAMETVAVLVTPDNDDQEIFLPVRNPIRVLSWLSRPRQLIASSLRPRRDQLAALALEQLASAPGPLPPIGQQDVALAVAADPVTPDNDDASIFLPVRNPIRVLSRLSRPMAGAIERADLVPAVGESTPSTASGGRVVALSGYGTIHLPIPNPRRRMARLAIRSTSRVELNLAKGKTPAVAAPVAAASARNDTARSAKRRRSGAKAAVPAKPRTRRKRKKLARATAPRAMRLGAKSRPRRSKSAATRQLTRRSRSAGSQRAPPSHWTKTVFTGLD